MFIYSINTSFKDIHFNCIGHELCSKSYSCGPFFRGEYIFHYILSGKGTFVCNNQSYNLKEGNGFLINPFDKTFYQADDIDPWHYFWINMSGEDVKKIFENINLGEENLIYSTDNEKELSSHLLQIIKTLDDSKQNTHYYLMSVAFQFLHYIKCFSNNSLSVFTHNDYVDRAINIILSKINTPITVEKIANDIGLERNYFTKVFKQKTGKTPKHYIKALQMEKAFTLLHSENISIQNIAFSCGFTSLFEFSKQFKQHFGDSPSQMRKTFIISKKSVIKHDVNN